MTPTKFLDRKEAVELLVQRELGQLSDAEKYDLLLDYWTISPEDPEFEQLPSALQAELASSEEPESGSEEKYIPLLLFALRNRLRGVRNEYLVRTLSLQGHTVQVTGAAEALEACPCCHYRTLSRCRDFDVCKVCFWEDDGSSGSEYSSPNHMSLAQARANFEVFGVVSEGLKEKVSPDARDKYYREREQ